MQYQIQKLDGRHAYRDFFQYYIGFSASMARQHGPVQFNDCMSWFVDAYGWSAEVRLYHKIRQWEITGAQILAAPRRASGILTEPSKHCNPCWSWSNAYADLRIYVATEQELAFFQLAHPVDQKRQ